MDIEIVKFGDTVLQVQGNFVKGDLGSWENPPEPDSFEIVGVCVEGKKEWVDITELITEIDDNFFNKIERQILENM